MATISEPLTLRERQRAEREALILEEAERLLGEHGYHDLIMDQLAERVGIAKGTIYLHFPKKEDLVATIIEHGLDRMTEEITALASQSERPAGERLREVMARLQAGGTGWMTLMTGEGAQALRAALHKRAGLEQRMPRFLGALITLIDQGKESGEFDPQIASPVAAMTLLSCVKTSYMRDRLEGFGLGDEEAAASVVRLFFHGLAARSQPEGVIP